MRAVVTRVKHASVTIEEKVSGQIGEGYLVLLGVAPGDTEETSIKLADKICNLRIFEDENEKMNLDLEQVEIYMPMISFSGGELAVVQAKSAEDAAKVKEIFQARLDSKTVEGPNNYPEEVEMWKRSAKVADHGSYVLLVNHDDSEAIVNEFNALFS